MHRRLVVLLVAAILSATVAVAAGAAPVARAASPTDRLEVRVPNFVFDPLVDGEPGLAEAQRFSSRDAGFRLVQFSGPTRQGWLESLNAAGLRVLQYYPHYTYLVWGAEDGLRQAESLDFVRWAGNFHPAYRLNSDLAGRKGLVQNVGILFYNDGKIEDTVAELTLLGAHVLQASPAQPDRALFLAVAELDASAFEAVSRVNTALWLGYSHPEPVLEDEMSDQILAGNYTAGVPFTGYGAHLATLGVTGAGVRWATIDTGVDYDHPDLGPSIVAGYSFPGACNPVGQPGSDCSGGGHGTHVTGIIGGDATAGFTDANGFLYGLGVAPGYDIVAMNSLSAAAWPPAGGWQEHSKQAVLLNAIGGNNSWTTGEGTAHGYQASERTHDFTVLDGNFDTAAIEPFIQVFSAGNSGPGSLTLTAPKEGKNLIVVASSRNYRAGSIDAISSFSSRGPAVDGRIVPTVAAPGEDIASSRNDLGGSCSTAIPGTNNYYAFCSGTSMAAPHVSGAVVLATEWWRGFNAGANPSPAMAKALLVNSAVPMGTIPNANEGWGRVDVTRMIQPGVHVEYWDQQHVFTDSGQQWIMTFGVEDPTKPVKITLAWSDAPGAAGANPALVNNLDLTVINGANTYLGNVFSGGWSVTGGTADGINNLENVFIQSPAGGGTIIIDAVNIAGDGVLGNADLTDQNFALICQNCVLAPDFILGATPGTQGVCAPSDALFTVEVGSLMGYSDSVTLSAVGNPAGSTITFGTNPVIPAGTSLLTIGNTGAAAAGSYTITVVGTAPTSTHSIDLGLDLFSASPAAATLVAPTNGATNVAAQPTFTWNAVAQAATYTIQVATDAGFSSVVASATGLTDPVWTSDVALNTSTVYYWRVWADNPCGTGGSSPVWSFTTVAAPGDCGPGSTPNVLYEYGFESGAAGWTTPAGVGTNTWSIVTTNPHSGANHYRGVNTASVTDQRLVSPAVVLPVGQNPVVLKFWHAPNLENSGASACYDGGILEISTNGGTTWTQVPNADLLVGGYTGPVSASFGNPLAGLQAWCGPNPAPYQYTIADVSAYAGQTVQFRYRLGTDTSVSRPGWDVDDVVVQSCQATAAPAIALAKTVGTTPGVCAATPTLDVPAGTTVHYCYTVTNTGSVALDLHDLADDQLGTIFSGFAYSLAPGASIDTVSAGLSISAVINTSTTNVATWTAYDAAGASATAFATATVNVAGIEVVKTVGTVDGVCAGTDEITVSAGTTVYYCYTATNTGDVALGLHTLVDDELGSLFVDLNYSLSPGGSVNTVGAGLSIPAVINATTTNTATWTAYNAGGVSVSDSATATVHVLQPADVTGTKTVSGNFTVGGAITYTIVLSNAGPGDQGDNPGDEFSDTLPAELTATGAAASSGIINRVGNTVTWNGAIPAGGSVTITITATINPVPGGTVILNQGDIFYDSVGDGENDATRLTDYPGQVGDFDPTPLTVLAVEAIPAAGTLGLLLLLALLGGAGVLVLRRLV